MSLETDGSGIDDKRVSWLSNGNVRRQRHLSINDMAKTGSIWHGEKRKLSSGWWET